MAAAAVQLAGVADGMVVACYSAENNSGRTGNKNKFQVAAHVHAGANVGVQVALLSAGLLLDLHPANQVHHRIASTNQPISVQQVGLLVEHGTRRRDGWHRADNP